MVFSIAVILFLAFKIVFGYKRGFAKMFLALIASVIAFVLTWKLGALFFSLMHGNWKIMFGIIVYLIMFIGVKVAITFLSQATKIVTKLPVLRFVDGVAGALLSLIEGLVDLLLVSLLIALLQGSGIGNSIQEMLQESRLLGWIPWNSVFEFFK